MSAWPRHRSDHARRSSRARSQACERRDVRRVAQDGDERDHLRGARHGHRHHRRARRAGVVGRRHPGLRRRPRQGRKKDHRAPPRRTRSQPGDIFVTNDPFYGGVTHLNDVVLAMPVFADGELVAWTANIAHWNDVGGMVPGSISNEAREIYQEGLRLPAVKIIEGGRPIAVGHGHHAREQPPARFPRRRLMGGHRCCSRRRAAHPRARAQVRPRDVRHGARVVHGLRRAGGAARARGPAEGPLRACGGAGQRRGVLGRCGDHRRGIHDRFARQPRPGPGSEQRVAGTGR